MAAEALKAPRVRRKAPKLGQPPAALTERRLTLICEKIANGVPQTTAAIAAGVPKRTFQNWLAKGREEGAPEPYASMVARIEAAIAVFHESLVQTVEAHAEKDPRTAMFIAERRFPDDWADHTRPGVSVNVNVLASPEWGELKALIVETLRPYPEALEALARRFADGPQPETRELVAAA